MDRVNTYGLNSPVASAELNDIQDTALGIAQMAGTWVTRPALYATGTTISDVFVGPTAGLVIGTTTVLPAQVETALSGTLAANTWYYVYGYNSSGAIAYEVSTTAPDAHLRHKTSDTSRAYVGCIRTRFASAAVIPFRMERGVYRWRWSKGADYSSYAGTPSEMWLFADQFTSGAGAANKVVSPKPGGVPMLPPHARMLALRGACFGNTASALDLGTGGDTGDRWAVFQPGSAGQFTDWQSLDIEVDASQQVRYAVAHSGDFSVAIAFHGFSENI